MERDHLNMCNIAILYTLGNYVCLFCNNAKCEACLCIGLNSILWCISPTMAGHYATALSCLCAMFFTILHEWLQRFDPDWCQFIHCLHLKWDLGWFLKKPALSPGSGRNDKTSTHVSIKLILRTRAKSIHVCFLSIQRCYELSPTPISQTVAWS